MGRPLRDFKRAHVTPREAESPQDGPRSPRASRGEPQRRTRPRRQKETAREAGRTQEGGPWEEGSSRTDGRAGSDGAGRLTVTSGEVQATWKNAISPVVGTHLSVLGRGEHAGRGRGGGVTTLSQRPALRGRRVARRQLEGRVRWRCFCFQPVGEDRERR